MSIRTKTLAIAAIVTACVTAAAASAHSQSMDPKQLVLRLGDMPSGFTLKKPHYVSNAEAQKADSKHTNYAKLGRVGGYEETFDRKSGIVGILEVDSTVNLYRSATDSESSLASVEHAASASNQTTYKRLAVGTNLGNEARLYMATRKSGKVKLDVYVLVWRSGKVLSAITAGGLSGSIAPTDVVALGKKQQRHIDGH